MTLRPLALALLLAGCAAGTDEPTPDPSADDADLSGARLRARTVTEDAVATGVPASITYEPGYALPTGGIPYLAMEIRGSEPAAADGAQTITVAGPFPGKPRALVVDDSFRVLARAQATAQPDGTASVTIAAPRAAGRRFLLVRDGLWTRPMSFQVHVRP